MYTVICPYCNNSAKLVTGAKVYPHRWDLNHLTFWMCEPCDAYVGVHKGQNNRPLGTLANAALRAKRKQLHRLFDPFWRHSRMSRTDAYRRLAADMGIDMKDCHIGMFSIEQCDKALETVGEWQLEESEA